MIIQAEEGAGAKVWDVNTKDVQCLDQKLDSEGPSVP